MTVKCIFYSSNCNTQYVASTSDQLGAKVAGDINIDPTKWRQAFASTGGVAVVGPGLGAGVSNFTITGGMQLGWSHP